MGYRLKKKKFHECFACQVGLIDSLHFSLYFCELMRAVVWFTGGNLSPEDLDLDGHDVWRAISYGDASPRSEILHNIDIESFPDSQLGFAYQGIGLRLGDMKLLMGVPNISYFIPPEDRGCTQTNKLSLQDLESVSVKSISERITESNPY